MSSANLGVGDLLTRLSAELSALRAMTAEVEGAVGELMAGGDGPPVTARLQALQLLDILNQSLAALATVCANGGALAAEDWRIDGAATTANLPLAGLTQRLSGRQEPAAPREGDELFGAD